MKNTKLIFKLLIFFILNLALKINAQEKMSFQSVVRNGQGKLVVNKKIGVRISVFQRTSPDNQQEFVA
jgi:hypothetical protein